MADAARDHNYVATMLLETPDGSTIPVQIDTVTGRILVVIRVTADTPGEPANYHRMDHNAVPITFMEPAAGSTPVPVLTDSDSNIWCDVSVE